MKQILTLILITLGIMTQAQEKVYLGSSTDGDKYYLYPSTIRKSTYGITAWYERIYAKSQYDKYNNKYYTYSKLQYLMDCKEMRYSTISIKNYSENGNVVAMGDYNLDLSPITPGSIGWNITEKTCKRYRGY